MELLQVITTTDSETNARNMARAAIEGRLAASVQVVGPISSLYWWQGEQHCAREWQCIAKTNRRLYPALEHLWLDLHPYEVPELFAVEIACTHAAYRQWLQAELTAK